MDKRKLTELKEKLMREMEMISAKQQLTMADINMIDTLAHAIKNLCKVIEDMGGQESGYSERHYVRGHYSRDDGSYGGGGSHGYSNSYSNNSYREAMENAYSNAMNEEEKRVIGRILDRM